MGVVADLQRYVDNAFGPTGHRPPVVSIGDGGYSLAWQGAITRTPITMRALTATELMRIAGVLSMTAALTMPVLATRFDQP